MFIKQGQICTHFAQCPVVDKLDDRWRIYYAYRDEDNRSHTTYMDVEVGNPKNILYRHDKEIIPLGDDSDKDGVMPTCIINVGESKYLYYVGWARKTDVPYENSTGLAISHRGGPWVKARNPILSRGEGDLFTGTMWVEKTPDGFEAYYLAGYNWIGKEPCYWFRKAHSKDGKKWEKYLTGVVPNNGISGCSFTRLPVLTIGNITLWSQRDNGKRNYTIQGGNHPILPSPEGWDSEMTCYPYLITHEEKIFCFYNGNGFGKTGIGYAILQTT